MKPLNPYQANAFLAKVIIFWIPSHMWKEKKVVSTWLNTTMRRCVTTQGPKSVMQISAMATLKRVKLLLNSVVVNSNIQAWYRGEVNKLNLKISNKAVQLEAQRLLSGQPSSNKS